MALAFPMKEMGLKPGAHKLGIKVIKVDAENDPFIRIAVVDSKPGDMVDTSDDGTASPPFPVKLDAANLKPGTRSTFEFTVP